jgi:hypothetical protein
MLDPPLDTMTQAEEEHALTHPIKQGRVKLRSYKTGENGARTVRGHPLDILLGLKLTDFDLAEELVARAKAHEGWAIQYIYNRLAGLPVQRHEDRLMVEVDETAKHLAEAYGLPIDEVRARAKRIAQGT